MSFETLAQTSSISDDLFLDSDSLRSCTLSPNNSFIACCYSSRVWVVRNVNSGQTLQTFQVNQPPHACFWSENYLWVLCTGEFVTFPYQPSEPNVLRNDFVECSLDFSSVLVFAAGILVVNDFPNVTRLFQVFGRQLRLQRKFDSKISHINVSADGRAVVFVTASLSMIQLLEMQCDGSWKLTSKEIPNNVRLGSVKWFGVIGRQNSRSMLFLTKQRGEMSYFSLSIECWNLSRGTCKRLENVTSLGGWLADNDVIYVEPDILIFYADKYVHFIMISNGKTIAKIYLADVLRYSIGIEIFYIVSRATLTVIATDRIKCFKIHNIESQLNTLPSQEPKQMKLTEI